MNLWKYIREKMMEHPNSKVRDGDAVMTFEEMCIFAEQFAKRLIERYYGIVCGSEMGTALALLSCFAAGKTAVPVPTRYGVELYRKYIDKAKPKSVITDLDGEFRVLPINETCKRMPEEAAVLLFTSGSTGSPKGVMLSGENIIANLKSIAEYFPLSKDDTYLIARPLYHSSVLTGEFLLSLCQGSNIVFSSCEFSPINILKLMEENEVTVFGSTPTLMSTLAKFAKKVNGIKIKTLSVSGECMTQGMAQSIANGFPCAKIICGYGLSEASPRVAYLPWDLFRENPCATGIPLKNVKIRIVGKTGKDMPKNEIGELIVKGNNVMIGYFQDKSKTNRTIRQGWLHTGDLAYVGDDELLYVKGRKDDMIIKAGMNIYPAEIENALSSDPRIERISVYGYEDNDTQGICMQIQGDFENANEVSALCRKLLPTYQMPTRIELVKHIDEGVTGKKKRRQA